MHVPKKFVVITRSRTGSNLLISLMNAHPEIRALGEVFARAEDTQSQWDSVFTKGAEKWAGFKIFYYHPMGDDDESVWDIILDDRDIAIIHLIRKNKLRTIVSRLIAGKTGLWKQTTTSEPQDKRVELPLSECVQQLQKTQRWEDETRSRFDKHRFLEVTYEDLKIQEVFEFLGLDSHPVESKLLKQNSEPLEDLIVNFEELQIGLENTEWSELLKS